MGSSRAIRARNGGRCGLLLIAVLAVAAAVRIAPAEQIVYSFVLNEAQMVPATGSSATGRAKASLSADETSVLFIIEHDVLEPVAASVHRGDFNTNGPVVFQFRSVSGLNLEEISGCPGEAGDIVTIELWMRDLPQAVTGFQAFLGFDHTSMLFRPDLSSYSTSPFPLHLQPIATAEVAPGELNLDGSGPLSFPPYAGTTQDARLATLRFELATACDRRLVGHRDASPFQSQLSFEGEPIENTNTSGLFVEIGEGCVGEMGEFIVAELWMRNLATPATGFQAFIEYDNAVLAYHGELSTYTDNPFPVHFQEIASAEVAAGQLNLDGATAITFPPDPGASADALLARLHFEVVGPCDVSLVQFRDAAPFQSELSFHGDPVIGGNAALSPIVATWQPSGARVQDLKDGMLYVRIDSASHVDGEIRGQIAVNPDPQPGDVIITEIMYHPDSFEGDPPATEWIELFNTTLTDIDISGWYFQDEDAPLDDPCTPMRGGSFPDFILRSFQLVVVIPDGVPGNQPTVGDFKTAWKLGSDVHVIQLEADGTANGAIVGGGLDNNPRNDGNPENDLPLDDAIWAPCTPEGPIRPDNEILTLSDGTQIIDVVNYDDDIDAEILSEWPENTPDGSITLVPADFPAATNFSTYTAAGNDIGSNWIAHTHGDAAGGVRQFTAAGVYGGKDVGSPGYLFGATPGNRAPAALSQKRLLGPHQTIDIFLAATDHTRPFFGFILFVIESLPANGQLIDVASNKVITPADVQDGGYLMPRIPFNHVRYVNDGTCAWDGFTFHASDGLLASASAEVQLIVQCGDVIITEIMYAPDSTQGAPPRTEWIELFNTTQEPVDLAGWYFADREGRGGDLPSYVLDRRSTVVVIPPSIDPLEFEAAWSAPWVQLTSNGVATGGLTETGLGDGGDDLLLIDLSGPSPIVSDAVCYVHGSKDLSWPDPTPRGPSIYVLPDAGYNALANDAPAAWGLATAGIDGAYVVTPTPAFDGVDIGSPGYLQGVTSEICGAASMPFDGDGSGEVDLLDFAYFVQCHLGPGPGAPALPANCACFDFDFDGDVDLADLAGLQVELGLAP